MDAHHSAAPLGRAKMRVRNAIQRLGYDIELIRHVGTFGLRVHRLDRRNPHMPPLLGEFDEALHHTRGGRPAAFSCPLERCVNVNGLDFRQDGWHPFSAALEQLRQGRGGAYEGSVLEQYYERWRPRNAREALIDPDAAPRSYADLPAHFIYLFPWQSRTVDEADRAIRTWAVNDGIEHGDASIGNLDEHGLKDHGPVSPEGGRFEFERLARIYRRLERDGFQREYGDVRVLAIRRGTELRFINFGGGLHRTAAMKALGKHEVPATLIQPCLVSADDIPYWPQVRAGVWDESSARRYVDHLFDFDARAWARSLGLVPE